MIQPQRIRLEYGKTDANCCIIEGQHPDISWALPAADVSQTAYRLVIRGMGRTLWNTGWVQSAEQELVYAGEAFEPGEVCTLSLELCDGVGECGEPAEVHFCYGTLPQWPALWIGEDAPQEDKVIYFTRSFSAEKPIADACLFVCGIGYQRIFVNGRQVEDAYLNPAFSEYEKRCYYTVLPTLPGLRQGENRIGVQVAAGWRSPYNACYKLTGKVPDYTGPTQLSAALKIRYVDGEQAWLYTDEKWQYQYGGIGYSNIFMGETFDAAAEPSARPARVVSAPGGSMAVQTLETVRVQETYLAIGVNEVRPGVYLADFGQNIAGICRIRIPSGMAPGQTISISHMEFLDEDGTLYLPNLRGAASVDRYVAKGNGEDAAFWQPIFTYHGFRYAQVEGYSRPLERSDIEALSLYTDVAAHGNFRCGNALVNAIEKAVVQTEKANIHSILTDCPQRDERMGWLNDATVRFEEAPYHFDVGRLFPKVVRDIMDIQGTDGSITCTAPFAFGSRPADPVCSSFLIAAWQAWLHTGNARIIAEGFDAFKAWNGYLESRSEGHIVQYSYYGDWAGPAYACEGEDGALSSVTPGIYMSTGYLYYNTALLAKMAAVLGRAEEAQSFERKANAIQQAFLRKWWDPETGRIATGSQGCQAFALWLGILPPEGRQRAAQWLHKDLQEHDYRITTGNLCTRYLMDALSESGYLEDAWALITREEYPSLGYMLQQEATTIWERFELKKNPGMNSHNHPMYAAVGYWFYACLAGIRPLEAGFRRVSIQPHMPQALLSAQAMVETVRGDISVRWVRRYGRVHLYVSVPAGVTAEVETPEGPRVAGGGFHHWSAPLEARPMG